jgi:signal peptide peptidase-like protein 2B
VATGGQTHEVLPILLLVPRIGAGPYSGYNILGFGDLVLPGLLLVYARMFDLTQRRSLVGGYFAPASIGYGVGLLLTYLGLALELGGNQVPCYVILALRHAVDKCSVRLLARKGHFVLEEVWCVGCRCGMNIVCGQR